jgi:DNA-binding transcriptional LysR family regulator
MSMLDLNDLYYFAAVVRHGGFAAAGRALNVPKSNLSRRIARLEQQLGVRLLERSTRRLVVTDIGQEFQGHCQQMIAQAEAAEEATQRMRGDPHGLVRLACPPGLAPQLSCILPKFLLQYRNVRVQVVASNRRVDLVEERIDVALRARRRVDLDPNLVTKVVGENRAGLVAAPALVASYPPIHHPKDLAGVPTLSMEEVSPHDQWPLFGPDDAAYTVQHEPRVGCSDFPLLLGAAVAGLGVALLPENLSAEAVASGRLVSVLPGWYTDQTVLHIVFTSRRGLLPAVRTFVDFLAAELPKVPWERAIRVSPELQ